LSSNTFKLQHEGLAVYRSGEVISLYAARAARGLGDGFAAILLPAT